MSALEWGLAEENKIKNQIDSMWDDGEKNKIYLEVFSELLNPDPKWKDASEKTKAINFFNEYLDEKKKEEEEKKKEAKKTGGKKRRTKKRRTKKRRTKKSRTKKRRTKKRRTKKSRTKKRRKSRRKDKY